MEEIMIRPNGSSSHIASSARTLSSVNPEADDASTSSTLRHDQRLVFAAQSGCQASFNELFCLYSRRVYRTALTITKNAGDAEDAMQDAFLRAFVAINRFEGRASFYSWVTRIAINSALMILRKRRTHPEILLGTAGELHDEIAPMDFQDSAPDPEEIYCQRQRHTKLIRAIQRLTPNLREVVRARLVEGCSVRDLATKFNISEAAAKSRLYRARMRLGVFPCVRRESASDLAFSSSSISFQGRTQSLR
jgi:RNA polymerase sigma-70 factor (ECF subfamily)